MTGTTLLYRVMERILREPHTYNQLLVRERHECGTRYCVLGHMGVVLGREQQSLIYNDVAAKWLGLDHDTTWDLASACALEPYGDTLEGDKVGTPEYALMGARHILAFIEQHKAHLDSWIVPGTESE